MNVLLQPAPVYCGFHPIDHPAFRQTLDALRRIARYNDLEGKLVVARRQRLRFALYGIDKGPTMLENLFLLLHPAGSGSISGPASVYVQYRSFAER